VKVGILGAGQLGRMLALAGYPLGFEFVFLDPAPEACAAPLGERLRAEYTDETALADLCDRCDLVTYEFENVPAAAASFVERRRPLLPSPRALTVGKTGSPRRVSSPSLGSRFQTCVGNNPGAAAGSAQRLGFPAVLKTRRLGYDGKVRPC